VEVRLDLTLQAVSWRFTYEIAYA